jgi:hypothetical protein
MSASTMVPSPFRTNTEVEATADGLTHAIPGVAAPVHHSSGRAPMTLAPSFREGGPGPPAKVKAICRPVQASASWLQARAAPAAAVRASSAETPGRLSR